MAQVLITMGEWQEYQELKLNKKKLQDQEYERNRQERLSRGQKTIPNDDDVPF